MGGAGGPTAQIVRLDQGKVYELDLKKKTYTEESFDAMRTKMQQAMDRAQQTQKQAGASPVDESQCEWLPPQADLRRTGERSTIAGYDAEHVVLTATQSCRDRRTGQVCDFSLTMDEWLAPQFAQSPEIQAFQHAYAQKLGMTLAGSREMSERAQAQFARYGDVWKQVAEKAKGLQGYPLKSIVALDIGGAQCQKMNGVGTAAGQAGAAAGTAGTPDAAASGASAGAGTAGASTGEIVVQTAGEAAARDAAARHGAGQLGGIAGQIGGKLAGAFMKHRKQQEPAAAESASAEAAAPAASATPAAAAAPAASSAPAPNMIRIIAFRTELVSVKQGVEPGAFDVPADFKPATVH